MKLGAKVAISGVISALAVVIMLFSFFPTLEIGIPALAGLLMVILVVEMDWKWGFMGYLTVSFIAFLLAPSLESRLLFICFFGYYPVIKALIERIRLKLLMWLIKFACFNMAAVFVYWLLLTVTTAVDRDSFTVFGVYLPGVILLLGNIVFLVYDFALIRIISTYIHIWQPRLHRWLHF